MHEPVGRVIFVVFEKIKLRHPGLAFDWPSENFCPPINQNAWFVTCFLHCVIWKMHFSALLMRMEKIFHVYYD